jgi:hypothetical protein
MTRQPAEEEGSQYGPEKVSLKATSKPLVTVIRLVVRVAVVQGRSCWRP